MKKGRKGAEGGSWMDTYGDMVTLLLCFFVLLYAISSVDQNKWENMVASMNPEAAEQLQEMRADEAAQAAASDNAMEVIYQNLTSEFESMGLDANVDIVRGDGYNFISFSDEIFFAGDSYVLLENGETVLDAFARAIEPAADEIHEIQFLGHTAKVPERSTTTEDRMLSSARAAQVTAYIQRKNLVDPGRMVSLGFGCYRPVAAGNTEESWSRNRRVEILITSDDAVMRSLTEYYAEVYGEEVAAMQPDTDTRTDTQTDTQAETQTETPASGGEGED